MTDTTTEPLQIDPDLAVRVQIELGYLRSSYVEDQVSRHLNRAEGDLTTAQIEALEKKYYGVWNDRHPALASLWFDVLRSRA